MNEKHAWLFRVAASLDVQNVQATSPQIDMLPRYVEYLEESFAIYVRALTGQKPLSSSRVKLRLHARIAAGRAFDPEHKARVGLVPKSS